MIKRRRTSKKLKPRQYIFMLIILLVAFFLISKFKLLENKTPQSGKIECIDGDTFKIAGETIRLLAIDAPELKDNLGKEASTRTCQLLLSAKEIVFDKDIGNEKDKYQRSLYWVFIDEELLQLTLVSEGLAEIKYVDTKTVRYEYLMKLIEAEIKAQIEGIGVWGR